MSLNLKKASPLKFGYLFINWQRLEAVLKCNYLKSPDSRKDKNFKLRGAHRSGLSAGDVLGTGHTEAHLLVAAVAGLSP